MFTLLLKELLFWVECFDLRANGHTRYRPLLLAAGMQMQTDVSEFEAILLYLVRLKPGRVTSETLS